MDGFLHVVRNKWGTNHLHKYQLSLFTHLYWENKYNFFSPENVNIPVPVSVYPDEIYTVSKRWAEQAYTPVLFQHT
jgi:hypothetical protein